MNNETGMFRIYNEIVVHEVGEAYLMYDKGLARYTYNQGDPENELRDGSSAHSQMCKKDPTSDRTFSVRKITLWERIWGKK